MLTDGTELRSGIADTVLLCVGVVTSDTSVPDTPELFPTVSFSLILPQAVRESSINKPHTHTPILFIPVISFRNWFKRGSVSVPLIILYHIA